ncbi:TPA: hypothetical protein JAN57_03255 [Legionella pneumophila]|nr:hypothetical protein [Legionella pneumophila]HAU1656330.1 hypothetical protein [Legionella pneumophila]
MMTVANLSNIDENQKIMRVIDLNALVHSIGEHSAGEQTISLPLNFLSYYQNCEDPSRVDKNEAQTAVNVRGVRCTVHACNRALVSCWSMIGEDFDPHITLTQSKFLKDKDDSFIIISTVGKVKKIIQEFVDIIRSVRFHYGQGDESISHGLMANVVCGKVCYYPEQGIDIAVWEEKTDSNYGIDMPIIQGVFHKEQGYSEEREFRFAILPSKTRIVSESRMCSMDTMSLLQRGMIYPKLIVKKEWHYIDTIYSLPDTLPGNVGYEARRVGIDTSIIEGEIKEVMF